MKIGIDIDEVVVEFLKGYLKNYENKSGNKISVNDIHSYNIWEVLNISKEESINLTHEFYNSPDFDEIEFLKEAKNSILELAKNHDICFITSRHEKVK